MTRPPPLDLPDAPPPFGDFSRSRSLPTKQTQSAPRSATKQTQFGEAPATKRTQFARWDAAKRTHFGDSSPLPPFLWRVSEWLGSSGASPQCRRHHAWGLAPLDPSHPSRPNEPNPRPNRRRNKPNPASHRSRNKPNLAGRRRRNEPNSAAKRTRRNEPNSPGRRHRNEPNSATVRPRRANRTCFASTNSAWPHLAATRRTERTRFLIIARRCPRDPAPRRRQQESPTRFPAGRSPKAPTVLPTADRPLRSIGPAPPLQ